MIRYIFKRKYTKKRVGCFRAAFQVYLAKDLACSRRRNRDQLINTPTKSIYFLLLIYRYIRIDNVVLSYYLYKIELLDTLLNQYKQTYVYIEFRLFFGLLSPLI